MAGGVFVPTKKEGETAAEYDNYASPKPGMELLNDGESKPLRGASLPMLFLLSSPRMPIQMAWAAQWAALGPFLGTLLPPAAVQLTQVVGPVTGVLVAPTIGVLSDRSTAKWGRRRPYLFYAAVASGVCWTLMGFTKEFGTAMGDGGDDHTWTAVFCIVFYVWMDTTVNIVQTPAFLIIADFAGDRQTTGQAIGQGWSVIGALMVSLYIWAFGNAYESLHEFLGMLAVVMVVDVTIVCLVCKETPLDPAEKDTSSTCSQVGQAFGSIYQGLATLPPQLVVYCVMMFCVLYGWTAYSGNKGQFFGLVVYDGNATDAGTCGDKPEGCSEAQKAYNKGSALAGGVTDTIFNIVSYVYLMILPFLVKTFGGKNVLTVAMIPQAALMFMAFCKDPTIDVIIVVAVSVTGATIFALLVPVIINVMGEDADIGMYVGAINSANCFGQLLNFIIGAGIVNTSLGYKLPVFVGGAVSFVAIIASAFFLKIKLYSL